jgi:hypothetical protein
MDGKMGTTALFAGLIMGFILGAILTAIISMCLKMFPKTKADLDAVKNDIPVAQDLNQFQPRSLIISILSRGSLPPPASVVR